MGCGICGFVGLSDKELLKSMCSAIRHRGPDSTGFFLDKGIGLGIDRLKIIDLSTGDQPIHNEDQSVWLVFNGEIYNYLELRRDLEAAGHRFYTSSDTEVIVHAYEEWKEEGCLRRLRGMFAFALWDTKTRNLFLARDRFGKKPLYYSRVGGAFLFGSELKSILQWKDVPRRLDPSSVDQFFAYMYIPSPATIFKDVRKLPPGSYAIYDARGDLTVKSYWDMKFVPDQSLTEDEVVDTLYSMIMEAVRIRMRSDVPLGAFLSGGIDSSVVVSMMSRQSDQPVKTVSIGFSEGTSEVRYSRQVAEFLKTDHTEHVVTPGSAFEILPRLVRHFDEPFADHSMIPTFYLSEVTREKVTVALSGDGGDELFMGYPFLNDPPSFGVYSKVPTAVRKPVLKAIAALPLSSGARRMANHAYEKDYGSQDPPERYAMRMAMLDSASLKHFYSESFNREHEVADVYRYLTELAGECPSPEVLDRLDYATIRSYLEEEILTKVDRMSMAVSLEVRCPLLDNVVADYVGTIPARLKMRGRETKYIFKKMAVSKNLVPKEIAHRKKQGFGAPLESWVMGSWRELMTQTLDPVVSGGYTGLFDKDTVKRFLADPYLYSNRLFALTVFVTWYRIYIDGEEGRRVEGASVLN